jgi:hypothetical protein
MSSEIRPVISLRGPLKRKTEGGWEWTGLWMFGLMNEESDEDNTEVDQQQSPSKHGKKKARKKQKRAGARPFRYIVSSSDEMAKSPQHTIEAGRNPRLEICFLYQ